MKKVRIAGYAGALLLLCGLALLLWKWPDLKARAEAGAAYGARIACYCRYVENRSMESCAGDMDPGMDMVSLDDDPPNRAVTGTVPLIATSTARLLPGLGGVTEYAGGTRVRQTDST